MKLSRIVATLLLLCLANFCEAKNNRYPEVSPELATADCKSMKEGWIVLYHIQIRAGIFSQKKRKPVNFVETSGRVHAGKWREKDGNVLVEWDTSDSSWRFQLDKQASYERNSFYPCRA